MHEYRFNIIDWRLSTSHLTLEESAVYRRLLDHYYATESPINKNIDVIAAEINANKSNSIIRQVLADFFTLKNDGWHNKAADKAIEKWKSRGWFPADPSIARLRPATSIWIAITERIHKRDGYTCQYCGDYDVPLECDHIHPVSRGGSNEDENLCSSCMPCNRSKSNKLLSEWVRT